MTFLARISHPAVLPLFLFYMLLPGITHAVTLTKDTIWEGEVKVQEDVLVPKGITLTIRPGTIVSVAAAESSKTDPEFISPLTEITIRGTLKIEGTEKLPVNFTGGEKKPGSWAGIIIDQGTAEVSSAQVKNAEAAFLILNGAAILTKTVLLENRYGIVAQGNRAEVQIVSSRITGNEYGVFTFQDARLQSNGTVVAGNRKKDSYSAAVKEVVTPTARSEVAVSPASRRYKDEVFRGDTVWQGRIEVAGQIRVPPGSRLIVLPGTIIEFLKLDTNGDGIGENGLLIQGSIVAKGTKLHPIIFRSAEKTRQMGDWDSINIMDSASSQNLIENCIIEDAYRGLHFHFSNVAVHDSFMTNNYRAIQFQESLVDMMGNTLYANKSGVQGRDSDVTLVNNNIQGNYLGANFFRVTLTSHNNRIIGNWREGMRIREGITSLRENIFDGNRHGLMIADMYYGDYSGNIFTNNMETGLSLKNVDNVNLEGNIIAGNGINGLNIQESRALIKGNQITDNTENGIGVQSFDGIITENNLAGNGLYAIDLDGTKDLNAPANWWGGDVPDRVIFDKRRDPSRGAVAHVTQNMHAFRVDWPLAIVPSSVIWRGRIGINRTLTTPSGVVLTVMPGTLVEFADSTGLVVKGRLVADGRKDSRIFFTSQAKIKAGDWDEIQLEYSAGSRVSYCVFEFATWGLHSHFTNLVISDSMFSNNYGGMRFRSGPLEVKRSVFSNNTIGIRSYIGNAVISENVISANEIGIFVREKGGGLNITRNNFFDNSSYNIRVGDFNTEDVPARGNWWGNTDPTTTIFDARSEPGIGNVLFEPFFSEPLVLNGGTSL